MGGPNTFGNPVRVALLGAGDIAKDHIKAMADERGLLLTAVFDPKFRDSNQRDATKAEHTALVRDVDGKAVKIELDKVLYTGFVEELYQQRGKFDAVVVAAPNRFHALESIRGLMADKDVLVEKPMATSVEDGKRMMETAQMRGRLLAVAQHFQKAPETGALIQGVLGPIDALQISRFDFKCSGCYPAGPERGWFRERDKNGGPWWDMGANALGTMRAILGDSDIRIQGTTFEYVEDVERSSKVVRVVANGVVVYGHDYLLGDNEVESRAFIDLTVRGVPGKMTFDWQERDGYKAATTLSTGKGEIMLDHAAHRIFVDGVKLEDYVDCRYAGIYRDFLSRIVTRESNAPGALIDVATIIAGHKHR